MSKKGSTNPFEVIWVTIFLLIIVAAVISVLPEAGLILIAVFFGVSFSYFFTENLEIVLVIGGVFGILSGYSLGFYEEDITMVIAVAFISFLSSFCITAIFDSGFTIYQEKTKVQEEEKTIYKCPDCGQPTLKQDLCSDCTAKRAYSPSGQYRRK